MKRWHHGTVKFSVDIFWVKDNPLEIDASWAKWSSKDSVTRPQSWAEGALLRVAGLNLTKSYLGGESDETFPKEWLAQKNAKQKVWLHGLLLWDSSEQSVVPLSCNSASSASNLRLQNVCCCEFLPSQAWMSLMLSAGPCNEANLGPRLFHPCISNVFFTWRIQFYTC